MDKNGNSDENSEKALRQPLLDDTDFVDLMEAKMKTDSAGAVSSIDEIAKQRNWREISTRIDTSLSITKSTMFKRASLASAALFFAAIGASTLLLKHGTETEIRESGVKGSATMSTPAVVQVFGYVQKHPLMPITDGKVRPGVELVFRTRVTQPGFSGLLFIPESGANEIFVNDAAQSPGDEALMIQSGSIVTYKLQEANFSATICALAAESAGEVRKIGERARASKNPLVSGVFDPESSCVKIELVKDEQK